jgi:hypothetical protein
MARKNITPPFRLTTARSLATQFFTSATNVDYLDNCGIIIDATGVTDNTGEFTVQVRFKDVKNPNIVSSWGELTLDTPVVLADADGVLVINLNQIPFSEFRIAFTPAGGVPDGIATIWIGNRQVGG